MAVEKVQKHIFISGRVQGVGFRAFIRREAAVLNIKGWAKNLVDGRVEVVIQGNKDKVSQMIAKLREGPSFAKVKNLKINDEEPTDFSDFKIKF
ncbi:MAG: acylphosphatase [Halanaerobium sp. 4-GBenrich]|jgi:acylphosphatase|uniref:Acylphosphatase n=1 Tax=Halanaerobium congolense TaxID=54121 RepID=A0A1G6P2M9_9FIRM|nr:acylphosphatase [Halanaerobium congolense]KXS50323.1 MAG: acylphosphatase [Halanaerobium sp. T82-1]ODS50356.1 MAG: acylphosphatase [Halanaerobium sp. 4-GBenrich]OEG62359.1 MAG: acylphosphatase [Halanaerobium sp. MDAL1]PUU91937.1 MAG: acylphosphatase [Halanaerobium sp.]PTX17135.1 acylphosphatase [Halanaerobium congolense]